MAARSRGGFTLIEVLIASAIGVLILVGTYIVYDIGQSTFRRTEQRKDLQQNARAALDTLVRQVRLAGYVQSTQSQSRIVIGTDGVLVIRGDVRQANLAPPGTDTIFGVYGGAPTPACPAPPCLMSHIKDTPPPPYVYTVGGATLALGYGIQSITFQYFSAANVLLPTPLDGAVPGAGVYVDGPTMVADPVPDVRTDRDAVARIVVTITAAYPTGDPRGTPSGPGWQPQTYALTHEIQLRNTCSDPPCARS